MKKNWIATSALAIGLAIPGGLLAVHAHAAPANGAAIGVQDRDHDWDRVPDEYNDVQRRGFHDGIEGARKDFDNHRQPSAENREEFRHPRVPEDMRHVYREAFRRGYDTGMRHMMGDHDHHDHDDHPY
jgi:hypothetical protein